MNNDVRGMFGFEIGNIWIIKQNIAIRNKVTCAIV